MEVLLYSFKSGLIHKEKLLGSAIKCKIELTNHLSPTQHSCILEPQSHHNKIINPKCVVHHILHGLMCCIARRGVSWKLKHYSTCFSNLKVQSYIYQTCREAVSLKLRARGQGFPWPFQIWPLWYIFFGKYPDSCHKI